MGFFDKIKTGLTKTRKAMESSLGEIFSGFATIDEEFYEELEESLILADLGVETSTKAVEQLRRRVKEQKLKDNDAVRSALKDILVEMLQVGDTALKATTKPSVVLVIGVNGVGKTTTIGKMANHLREEGKRSCCAPPTPSGPPRPTSWKSGRSAAVWKLSASMRAPTRLRWFMTPLPPPGPEGRISSFVIRLGGSTTSRI